MNCPTCQHPYKDGLALAIHRRVTHPVEYAEEQAELRKGIAEAMLPRTESEPTRDSREQESDADAPQQRKLNS